MSYTQGSIGTSYEDHLCALPLSGRAQTRRRENNYEVGTGVKMIFGLERILIRERFLTVKKTIFRK